MQAADFSLPFDLLSHTVFVRSPTNEMATIKNKEVIKVILNLFQDLLIVLLVVSVVFNNP